MSKFILRNSLKIACFQKLFKRKYWLLVDNIFNDNAELVDNFSLFEYLQTKEEFKDITYYVINKNNINYNKIKSKYKNIIPVKNCSVNFALIKKLFFTKYWLDSFQVLNRFNFKFRNKLAKSEIITIYTQHGINFFKRWYWDCDEISDKYFKKIIFSNEKERDLFKQFFGYNDDNAILAGLSRWDNMQKENREKAIFIYFTFRSYLRNPQLLIKETDYYKNILKLLTSNKFNKILENYGVKVYLGLHHELKTNLNINLPNIKIIDDSEISTIKQKASMLLTDYSSMCFDFMYKDIPVCFYRLDKDNPLLLIDNNDRVNNNYVEERNDLYNVCYDDVSVIDCIEKYCKNNFQLENEYKSINNKFFTYRENIKDHIIKGILNSPIRVSNGNDKVPQKELELNKEYFFYENMPIATDGLWVIESFGRNSIENIIKFWIKIPNETSNIELKIRPILYNKVKNRKFNMYINDEYICTYILNNVNKDSQINIPLSAKHKTCPVQKLTFELEEIKPQKTKLGLKFISLKAKDK